MPELPEVETVRRGLEATTLGFVVVGGQVLLSRAIAAPQDIPEFWAGLVGTTLQPWQRRGKYLLAPLQRIHADSPPAPQPDPHAPTRPAPDPNTRPNQSKSGGWLGIHLRMTGQLLWLEPGTPLQKHTRIRLWGFPPAAQPGDIKRAIAHLAPYTGHTGQDVPDPDPTLWQTWPTLRELRFVDQRTFGHWWWVPPDRPVESVITGLAALGPEPLGEDFQVAVLADRLHRSQRTLKAALLDQGLVAGLGNIYADESLFLSGIRPETRCCDLPGDRVAKLHQAIVQVLQASIAAGGTTFSTFLGVTGVNGNYGGQAWVYGRTGEPCRRCQTPISRIRLAGRSTHFCSQCQQ